MAFQEYWDKTHKEYSMGKIEYDNWLDKYSDVLSNCHTKVLDLGCGVGNNALYLKERGLDVIACDYSKVALDILKSQIDGVETMLIDISDRLPFENQSFDVIVADLSLHYFDSATTFEIMNEIKRILTKEGILLARVNSVDDLNFGAGSGEKIENNYYFVNGYNKRFFSIDDVNKYFSKIGKVNVVESTMTRYTNPKKLLEIKVEK